MSSGIMLTIEKRRKLLILDSSTLTYTHLERRSQNSLDTGSPTNEIYMERYKFCEFHHLYKKLREYPELFKNYTRISVETFDHIVKELKNDFTLKATIFMRPTFIEERLILSLSDWNAVLMTRFFAASAYPSQLLFANHCGNVCKNNSVPQQEDYTRIASVTDANYEFVFVDVGGYGKNSDSGIFSASKLGKFLESNSMELPEESRLPNTNIKAPHVLIGVEGFPL
ncbi:hypothetical protein J437_LFUL018832 [Ladona fulva]|uniref:DDE Tnp4 domain-containing protein n=1 Tax=Ladona fulva TaxID=123851 RepID=A0A8K0JW57_LADFU|nr:hypothetical protein J437_LFUL018832 [Ladona fulva]